MNIKVFAGAVLLLSDPGFLRQSLGVVACCFRSQNQTILLYRVVINNFDMDLCLVESFVLTFNIGRRCNSILPSHTVRPAFVVVRVWHRTADRRTKSALTSIGFLSYYVLVSRIFSFFDLPQHHTFTISNSLETPTETTRSKHPLSLSGSNC